MPKSSLLVIVLWFNHIRSILHYLITPLVSRSTLAKRRVFFFYLLSCSRPLAFKPYLILQLLHSKPLRIASNRPWHPHSFLPFQVVFSQIERNHQAYIPLVYRYYIMVPHVWVLSNKHHLTNILMELLILTHSPYNFPFLSIWPWLSQNSPSCLSNWQFWPFNFKSLHLGQN